MNLKKLFKAGKRVAKIVAPFVPIAVVAVNEAKKALKDGGSSTQSGPGLPPKPPKHDQ